ncbi:MAG: DUF4954 family protein [Pirellulales bacterium]|nr:DUF4954 family protein [Pirellulales bacterium]
MTSVSTLSRARRALSADEISCLRSNGCIASDWSNVTVAENFRPECVRDVTFSGRVSLGEFTETHRLPGGWEHQSGVYRAALYNVSLGDNVLVRNVGRHIANYEIGNRALIDHVDLLVTEGKSTFGNGTMVNVVNEVGGRGVPLVDRLSAQLAYVLAFYRHRDDLQQQLRALIDCYVQESRSQIGFVGAESQLVNCGALQNVRVGEAATISGAARLANGTIHSNAAAPTTIGDGVIAENFIAASGSLIDSGARLDHCFAGQGVVIARGFSADHSLIFANSELKHGEACSLFAGPFTTTHHKASLLIAGLFSFSNAGSGSNQSNHLYKLGPLHEGILERGVKTGSSCYVMWPARVGAFSVVLGRHSGRFNTSDFPFSYLFEVDGKTLLVPAANLTTVGPRRDEDKWRRRDRRTDPDQLDLINARTHTPYTAARMIRAVDLLRSLDASSPADSRTISHGGVRIQRSRLHKATRTYEMAIQRYLGDVVASRLESVLAKMGKFDSLRTLLEKFKQHTRGGTGKWVDIAGLYTPQAQLEHVLERLTCGEFHTLDEWSQAVNELGPKTEQWEWDWVLSTWTARIGKLPGAIDLDDVIACITVWQAATAQSNKIVLRDAESEFSERGSVAFGLDGDDQARRDDFRAVRGSFDRHAFVQQLQQEDADTQQRAEVLLARLERIRQMG